MIPWFTMWIGCMGDMTPSETDTTDTTDTTVSSTADTGSTEPCVATAAGEVCTEAGLVVGGAQGTHWRWQGIPFAAPPVGALRWQPPAPAEPWSEPLVADALGSVCPQWEVQGETATLEGQEDCLTLNVVAPDAADGAPVLVFVHGGGHQQGDSASLIGAEGEILYEGATFAEAHGAVVVTANYRLGPLGFMAHPDLDAEGEGSGNYGMLDQIAALQWVQDNIAGFGGDPDRVLVFGESAGSVSVCRLLVSPRAAGLFSAVGMQSGGCTARAKEAAEAIGIDVASQLGCDTDAPSCLREQSVQALMDTVPPGIDISALGAQTFTGTIDGDVLPDAPRTLIEQGMAPDVPVILGSNAEETGNVVGRIDTVEGYQAAVTAWATAAGVPGLAPLVIDQYPAKDYASPRDAYVALTTDSKFTCGNRRDARLLRDANDSPVYRYRFAQVPENGSVTTRFFGAFHGLELFYLFDQVDVFFEMGDGDRATQEAMAAAWVGMAATGSAGSEWVEYNETEAVTLIDAGVAQASDPSAANCDFWDGLGG